ncbi:MAG: HAD-IC family P-type ATPase [Actinobacteria bacterium]|nr:HAD-IC family P-type ATPase [Actinomycetota bacterium]MBU1608192.1 HAD-IC family P-type ATPase [Actinomycetota bacterium]MBU2315729.1 HAD-IC family P-type ATPase [Actinomycetota bacterium]MBU2384865.1 HAD-IC family P-type ATPase [Actinomycetota bacterium]
MPSSTGRSFWRIMQANLFTLFNLIVGGAFALLLVLGYWQDALFGLFVIANVVIGVAQEFRAKITLSRLAVLNAPKARVLREGTTIEAPTAEVVLDDILVLAAGDQVTADAEVLEAHGLDVDESLLTGEADPVASGPGRELMSGSTVVAGSGLARVVRVGGDSYAARITAEAKQFALVRSELRGGIARIIRWITVLLLPVGAIVVNGQMQAAGGWAVAIESGAWREAAVAATASLIAMIPQGLVFMTSVALAVGAVKLAQHEVLVQELAAVEGLARVDMLCLDKTGTLTEGRMVLNGVEPLTAADLAPAAQAVLAWMGADRDANATTRALVERFTAPPTEQPVRTIEFSSRRKWSAVSFADGPARGTWVLGAPDIVLADVPDAADALARFDERATAGERTVVLARTDAILDPPVEAPEGERPPEPALPADLAAVALVSFREKVRDDAHETLDYFREQEVELCVISGDDPRTVAAVAREAGIHHEGPGYDARQLPEEDAALDAIMAEHRVFGRVTPEQKKAMVLSLQRLGHTVAMTGDGVNDALALKHADLGIAMGSGAAATRAVARLVLLDGQFSRLPRVVAEGRQVIANVERLAKLFLSKTTYAILFAVVFGALLWPFPFLPRQLSIVDGLTIGLPALVLALLPNIQRYRPGFLRRAARFCIPSGLVVGGTLISVVAYAYLGGYAPPVVQTAAVITLTLTALWVLVILSRPFTWITSLVVVAAYAGLGVVFAIPAAVDFLQLGAAPLELILVAVGASAIGSLLLEVMHRVVARSDPR